MVTEKLKADNLNVAFPKKFINDGKIISVSYELFLVKEPEESDKPRLLRDGGGKLYEEPLLLDKWRPLQSIPFKVEEAFWLYGHESKKNRKSAHELVKLVTLFHYIIYSIRKCFHWRFMFPM